MHVISDTKPEKLEFENQVGGMIDVIFNLNIKKEEVFDEEGNKKDQYSFDQYRVKKGFHIGLDKEILANFDRYAQEAQDIDYEKVAEEVRAKRNALLDATDKDMAFDRLGINVEDFQIPSLSLTNIVTFVKTLAEAVKSLGNIFKNVSDSDIAKYRQALRDITEQPGFPYDVQWPELKKNNNE